MAIEWMSRLANLTSDQKNLNLETEEERKKREAERGELVRSYPYPQYSNQPDPYKPEDNGVRIYNSGSRSYQNGKPILAVDSYPRAGTDYSYHSTTPDAKYIQPERIEKQSLPLDLDGLYEEEPEKKPNIQEPIVEEPYKTYADVPKTVPEFQDSKPEVVNPLRDRAKERMMQLDNSVSKADIPIDNSPNDIPSDPLPPKEIVPQNMSLTEAPESPFPAKEVQTPSDLEKNALERLKRQWDYTGDAAGSEGEPEQATPSQEYTGGRPEDMYAPFVEPITPKSSSNPLLEKIMMGAGGFAHIMGTPEMDRIRLNRAQMGNEMSNSAQRMFNAVPGVNLKDRDYVTPISQQIQLKNTQEAEQRNISQQKFNNTATLARISAEKQVLDRQEAADWEIIKLDIGVLSHNKRTNETKFRPYNEEEIKMIEKNKVAKAAAAKSKGPFDTGFTPGMSNVDKQLALNKSAPIEIHKEKAAAATVISAYREIAKDPTLIKITRMDLDPTSKIEAQKLLVNWFDANQLKLIPFIAAQASSSNSGVLNQGEFERFTQNLMGISLSRLFSIAQGRAVKGSTDEGIIARFWKALTGGVEDQISALEASAAYTRLLALVPEEMKPSKFADGLYQIANDASSKYRRSLESIALKDNELGDWGASEENYVGRTNPYFTDMFNKEGGDYFVKRISDSLPPILPPKEPEPAFVPINPTPVAPVATKKAPVPVAKPKGKPLSPAQKLIDKNRKPSPAPSPTAGSWRDSTQAVKPAK
jgi:hypothetical protein